MNKKREAVIRENEISEVVVLTLGGYKQKVLIEGKKSDLPVVITLHGGPGSPIPFGIGCRGMFPEFTDEFIMVYWDQLGCGANDAVIGEEFHINDFVTMTVDLIEQMKLRFPNNKLILFGISWGSVPCLQTVDRLGSKIDAALVWGQITNHPICNKTVLNEIKKQKLSRKDEKRVIEVEGQPVTPEIIKTTAILAQKYTNAYINKEGEKAPIGKIIWQLLTSPDYKFKDFLAMVKNGSSKNRSIWEELIKADYTEMLCGVSIPYLVIQGDTDYVTDTKKVEKIIHNANNPNLTCKVIEKSGHIPGMGGIQFALKELLCLK